MDGGWWKVRGSKSKDLLSLSFGARVAAALLTLRGACPRTLKIPAPALGTSHHV